MWETNCKETLSDGVAQEFAIQYVSVSPCHTRDLARETWVSLTCVMWSDNSENENLALQTPDMK